MTRDPEFDAISAKDIFLEARDRLKIAKDANSQNDPLAKDDLLFREGEQWLRNQTTSASEESPELTINLTDALCQRVENNIKQQRPRGKAHPVGDGADLEIAEIINGIGRHVETRSEASVAYDQAARSALTNGWGYFRIIAEYVDARSFQKDLRILPIRNVFTVSMDPAAIMPSGCDMGWCLLSVKMKKTEFKRRLPRKQLINWAEQEDARDWDDQEEIRLAEYFRLREKAETLFGLRNLSSGQEMTFFESEMPPTLAEGWQIEGSRESSRRAVEWFRLNGLEVVSREQLPGQWIPVFRVEGNATDIDGRVYRRGMVRGMKDPQRMVNYGEVAKIKRLGLTPKAAWVAAEGQLEGHPEWYDSNLKAYSVLEYKPVTVMTAQGEAVLPPPQRQPPAQIEAGFGEFVQGMRTNLLAVSGMPNEPGADKQGEVVSGVALDKRQLLSDQSHFQYYDNLTLAIAQCWRVMVEWIPAYFNDPGRLQRIIGEDSTPRMVTLKQRDPATQKLLNDLSVGRYDVVMDTGPGYETKRQEGADNLIEMLKIQALAEIIAKTAPDLVFRSIDHPYMQEIADRLMAQTPEGLQQIMEQLPERARNVIMAISKENQNLKQALQQAQMEQKAGLAKAHLDATVKAHDVEESNLTKRHDTQVKADTALRVTAMKVHGELAKEEIKAGASLMNTHTEAKYHAAEAERMIEAGESAEGKSNGHRAK